MEYDLANTSKIVVNTQPPLHEVWLRHPRPRYHFPAMSMASGSTRAMAPGFRAAVGGGQWRRPGSP